MNKPSLMIRLLLAGAACACLSGCLNLKPVRSSARYFVLSSLPPATVVAGAPGSPSPLAAGLGQVKIPGYLYKDFLAVRKGTNEVEYLQNALWAEKLSNGFQRVLAENLSVLLPSDQVRLSAWHKADVAMEVYVVVAEFDADVSGRTVLVAGWRILSPGGERILKAGQFRGSRQTASPLTDAKASTASLSELVADLSRELAAAMKAVVKAGP